MKPIYIELFVIISFIFLISCSSNPQSIFRSPSAIKDNLKQLEGKSVDEAINIMGLPEAEQVIAGRRILVWSDSGSVTTLKSQPLLNPNTGQFESWVYANKRDFKCVVRAVIENDRISLVEVKANSVYYCPGQRKKID